MMNMPPIMLTTMNHTDAEMAFVKFAWTVKNQILIIKQCRSYNYK